MTAIILFAILILLLVATGFMPGVLRSIGTFCAIATIAAIYVILGPLHSLVGVVLSIGGLFLLNFTLNPSPERERKRYLRSIGLKK